MAAILRSAIGRARRGVPEGLLTLLRGPRPSPAAAPSAEVDLLAKKVDDAGKKDQVIELAKRLIQEEKKKYEPPVKDWEAVPFLTAIFFAATFAVGCKVGRDRAEGMRGRG